MKLLFSYPWQGTASFRRETGCESARNRKCFRAFDSNTTIKNETANNENTNNQNGSLNNE